MTDLPDDMAPEIITLTDRSGIDGLETLTMPGSNIISTSIAFSCLSLI